jgi:cytochrome c-type biogenesis protein CcmH/NrfG
MAERQLSMSFTQFSCPACRVSLKSPKPIPAGKRLVCPYCDSRFSLPVSIDAKESAPPIKPTGGGSWASTAVSAYAAETDLRRLYRRFALLMIATVMLLSAAFGTALYLVVKNRPARAITKEHTGHETKEHDELRGKEEESNRKEWRELMILGGVALGNHRFEDAIKAYQDALRLYPDDVEAAKGLSAARSALEEQAQVQKEGEKRQAEFTRLMEEGQEAMKNRQLARAAQAFDNALRLLPDNPSATKALREANEALDAQQVAKKKAADFESHMTAARAAMVGQRYAEARDRFLAALQSKPDDPAALEGHKQAEKRLNEIQDEEKRRVDFNRFMDQGDRALRNHRYEEAERAYAKAVKLLPRDLDAHKGLREAQKGLEKMKQEFKRLLEQGDLAMQTLRFGDAVRAYSQATKLFPDNESANEKLQTAQKALDDVGNAQAAYNRFMLQGAAAMRLGRFGDASVAYSAALRLAPGDLDALAGLRSARGMMFGPPVFPVFP